MTKTIFLFCTSALLVSTVLSACGSDSDEPDAGGELTPPDCTVRGPRMLRRLSGLQLRNTLQVAFQDANVPQGDVVTDPVVHGFKGDATQAVVRDLDAQLILSYSESVADWAVTQKLGQLTTCQALDAACGKPFIAKLGQRLFREPLSAQTTDAYFAMLSDEATFADGARAVISTMIQSPYFLYRRELGEEKGGVYRLTPYELASSLSYMLTNFPPDDALMAAAAEGRLSTPADLDLQVARLLEKPEAEAAFGRFTRSWLEIDDLLTRAKLDPSNQLTDAVRAAMIEETTRFFMQVLRSGGKRSDLFTATYTFLDQTLANYYQLGGVGGGFQQVQLPPNTRSYGLLGQGAFLTRHALADSSSPVQRGKSVRERMLCEVQAPPPPNVVATLPPPAGAVTTRQRYEGHSQSSACQGCHTSLDPVGFAFERYDGFGRKRDQENGIPVNTTGKLTGMAEGDINLDSIDSLSTYLATSKQASSCMAEYMSYNAFGLDRCSKAEIDAEIAASDGSLKAIVSAIVHSPHFATRTKD
jgi:mono/diheme cytochrome c family protein